MVPLELRIKWAKELEQERQKRMEAIGEAMRKYKDYEKSRRIHDFVKSELDGIIISETIPRTLMAIMDYVSYLEERIGELEANNV